MTVTSRTVPASARMPWWVKAVLAILLTLVVLAILCTIIAIFGRVHGAELSPQTFEQRTYIYWQVPVLGMQVTAISRTGTTGALENHLLTNKLIPPLMGAKEWDLVTLNIGMNSELTNDSQILVRYLEMSDAGGYPVWLRWSEDHPEYAQVLWPTIARLVGDGLYVHVPSFFRLAREATDATEFETALAEAELALRRELAARWEKRDRPELAKVHYQAALALAPNDEKLRAKVKELGGDVEAATKVKKTESVSADKDRPASKDKVESAASEKKK